MGMIINQEYMEENVIKPIDKRLKDIEAKLWLINNGVKRLLEKEKEREEKEKKIKKVK